MIEKVLAEDETMNHPAQVRLRTYQGVLKSLSVFPRTRIAVHILHRRAFRRFLGPCPLPERHRNVI
jgi:hypothetical protein